MLIPGTGDALPRVYSGESFTTIAGTLEQKRDSSRVGNSTHWEITYWRRDCAQLILCDTAVKTPHRGAEDDSQCVAADTDTSGSVQIL